MIGAPQSAHRPSMKTIEAPHMLARGLRLILGVLLLLAVAICLAVHGYTGSLALAAISWLIFPVVLGVVLGSQFVALAFVSRRDSVPQASTRQMLGAWRSEAWLALLIFGWRQAFRSDAYADQPTHLDSSTSVRGVLLVHGFVCNRGLWNDWYPVLRQRDIPFIAVDLEPVFSSIDHYSDILNQAVAKLDAATGMKPLVICHSMGGLAVRAWLARTNADEKVHRIVTLGSPHHGTRAGDNFPQLPGLVNANQMRFGSDWLALLGQQESMERRRKFVCIYSNCDNIVTPTSSAMLSGADNRHFPGIPHLALVLDPTVRDQSLALLA